MPRLPLPDLGRAGPSCRWASRTYAVGPRQSAEARASRAEAQPQGLRKGHPLPAVEAKVGRRNPKIVKMLREKDFSVPLLLCVLCEILASLARQASSLRRPRWEFSTPFTTETMRHRGDGDLFREGGLSCASSGGTCATCQPLPSIAYSFNECGAPYWPRPHGSRTAATYLSSARTTRVFRPPSRSTSSTNTRLAFRGPRLNCRTEPSKPPHPPRCLAIHKTIPPPL